MSLEAALHWFKTYKNHFDLNSAMLAQQSVGVRRGILENDIDPHMACALGAHSKVKDDSSMQECLNILKEIFMEKNPVWVRRKMWFECVQKAGVVLGFFQDGCLNEKSGGQGVARPQNNLCILKNPSQMPHFTKMGRYIQLKMIILSNVQYFYDELLILVISGRVSDTHCQKLTGVQTPMTPVPEPPLLMHQISIKPQK